MSREAAIEDAASLTAKVLKAYLPGSGLDPAQLPALVRDVRAAFEGRAIEPDLAPGHPTLGSAVVAAIGAEAEAPPPGPAVASQKPRRRTSALGSAVVDAISAEAEAPPPKPAVPISKSIHDDFLISLEDGGRYRSLRRHLMSKYGMSPDDYRARWSLPADYPMVAPSYSRARSDLAKRIGLGGPRDRPRGLAASVNRRRAKSK
jgi:predicted transcriptional regulator